MIISQSGTVDIIPEYNRALRPIFCVSEGDADSRMINLTVKNAGELFTIPGGASVYVAGKKLDNTIFTYECTYSGYIVTFPITAQMSAVSGLVLCELQIVVAGDPLGSANFCFWVEPSPIENGTTSESDLNIFVQAISDLGGYEFLTDEISVLSARMDQFARLPDGSLSTAADAELADVRVKANSQTAATAGDAVREQVTGLQNEIVLYGGELYGESGIDVYQTLNGYRLNASDGLCTANADYKIVKYAVSAGSVVKIVSGDRFQFQNKPAINTSGASNKIGATHGTGTYYMLVPDGATFLLISTLTSGVADAYNTTSIKNEIKAVDDTVSTFANINRFNGWMFGAYKNTDGIYQYRTDYLCTPSKIPVSSGNTVEVKINIYFVLQFIYVQWYDSNSNFIGHSDKAQATQATFTAPENAAYFNISITKQYAVDMVISDYSDTTIYANLVSGGIFADCSALVNNSDLLFLTNWANRIYYFGQGNFAASSSRIGLQATFKTQHRYRITAKDGYNITAGAFTDATPSVSTEAGHTAWVTECILEKDTYYILNCRKTDDTNLVPNEYGVNPYITIEKLDDNDFTNFAITGFAKTGVTVLQVGILPNGFQAFCKYNGDIYSVQEGNIYHINGETFALLNSAEISVGHANSMQLGSGNIAYISGWNDQKVYAVNLDTLTVSAEYTLPVGDTTTVAVDDINELMYIFHKADPNTVGYYDFIVYNYDTEQIVSSKKITVPFAAMQACQFVDGLIFAANGLATTSVPNGYRVYNTNGDVVQSYVLPAITSEPEGVFYDKDTNKLLISDLGKRVFQIT